MFVHFQTFALISLCGLLACGDPTAPPSTPDEPATPVIRNSLSLQLDTVAFGPEPEDYYLIGKPEREVLTGVLFFMSGFAQAPESILPESDLPKLAVDAGMAVVLLGNGPRLATTPPVLDRLDWAVAHFRENHPTASEIPWSIGGFSAGGTRALRYAEDCGRRGERAPVKWRAVFGVDPPVDLFEIRDYFQREIEDGTAEVGIDEARFATAALAQNLGTLPTDSTAFLEATPFAAHLKQPGNERWLRDTAVRLYHDVDIDWLVTERGRTARDGNFGPASALIVALRRQGHPAVEFIQSTGEGYRANGTRHPHSWSIVGGAEAVGWLLGTGKPAG